MAFYKTTITVTILSDGPYEAPDGLNDVDYDITDGDCSGDWKVLSTEELTKEEMIEACNAMGTDPAFFSIEEDQ